MNEKRETFSVYFYLKSKGKEAGQKRSNSGELSSIMGRVTVNARSKGFSTKCRINPKDWNQVKQQVKGDPEDARRINKVLKIYRNKAEDHYNELFEKNNGRVTVNQVYAYLFGKFSKTKNLLEFFDEYLEEILTPKVKLGDLTDTTCKRYEETRERLAAFIQATYGISDVTMNDIYPMFITKFYLYIRENYQNCHNNGTLKYVQKFRTIILAAKANGVIDHDPFVNYQFSWDKFDRGFLTEEEITRIMPKNAT